MPCGGRRSASRRATRSRRVARSRLASSGRRPRPTPGAGSPRSTSATAPLCFGRLDLAADGRRRRRRPVDRCRRPFYIGRISVDRGRPHAARRRLAGAGRRALLPGDRGRADGRRPPPPLPDPRPATHRARRRGLRRRHRPRRRASPWWARARCSRRSTSSAPGGCATSSPRSRPSRTKRSARRSPASSSSPGGPGTGKTAVALHRAAYLLYSYRKRLGSQGVLLVGPEPDLPPLHRRGAPVARRGRGRAGHARRRSSRASRVRATAPPGRRRDQGRPPHGAGDRGRGRPTASGPMPRDVVRADRQLPPPPAPARVGADRRAHAGASRECTTNGARTSSVWWSSTSGASTGARWSRLRTAIASTSTTSPSRRCSRAASRPPEDWEAGPHRPDPAGAGGPRRARAHVAGPERRRARARAVRLRSAGAVGVRRLPHPRRAAAARPRAECRRARGRVDRRRPAAHRRGRRASSGRGARRGHAGAAAGRRNETLEMARRTVEELGVGGSVSARSRSSSATATTPPTPSARTTANCARSATCSSTRRRTSPRCSGGCSPAAARRGR